MKKHEKRRQRSISIDEMITFIGSYKQELMRKYSAAKDSDSKYWLNAQTCCMMSFQDYLLDNYQKCDFEKCKLFEIGPKNTRCKGSSEEYNNCPYRKALEESENYDL